MKGPFHSPPRPDSLAAWTNDEVAKRLEAVFALCVSEYHFVPSADDWTALQLACDVLRLGCCRVSSAPVCPRCSRRHTPDKDCI
jgi:hypothetical protein